MVSVKKRKRRTEGCGKHRTCKTEGCGNRPSFGVAGTKTAQYCLQHAPDEMVDVHRRKCRTGMVNVHIRKCKKEGCGKRPSFGAAGSKTVEYCAQHAPEGMVDVKNGKCKAQG
ncbi:unnamed protein product, partial [Ascophyllum nodosum]